MEQILYILFGWLLGLIGPQIIGTISASYAKASFFRAIVKELQELHFRVTVSEFNIRTKAGVVDAAYLERAGKQLEAQSDQERGGRILKLINMLKTCSEVDRLECLKSMKNPDDRGMEINTVQASFTTSNVGKIGDMPIEFQSKVHDLLNSIHNLNQIINRANESLLLTLNSSLSPTNHERVSRDLDGRYLLIADTLRAIAEKAIAVIEYKF